jgi:hypothetical protein
MVKFKVIREELDTNVADNNSVPLGNRTFRGLVSNEWNYLSITNKQNKKYVLFYGHYFHFSCRLYSSIYEVSMPLDRSVPPTLVGYMLVQASLRLFKKIGPIRCRWQNTVLIFKYKLHFNRCAYSHEVTKVQIIKSNRIFWQNKIPHVTSCK